MAASIIIIGPQGSGKNLAAEALCAHYGLVQVWDAEDPPFRHGSVPRQDALILATEASRLPGATDLQVIHIEDALKAAGVTLEQLRELRGIR